MTIELQYSKKIKHLNKWSYITQTFIFLGFILFLACDYLEQEQKIKPLKVECLQPQETRSPIKHLVVVIQENHSFDSYFGNYCKAPTNSNPKCTLGPECCEAGPKSLGAFTPVVLNDAQNLRFDPRHGRECEIQEMNNRRMDKFIQGTSCSDPQTYAYADAETASIYWNLAANYSLADRYFQPSAGASAQNNMYFAQATFVFEDNSKVPDAAGGQCYSASQRVKWIYPTIGDALAMCKVPWAFYSEGYNEVLAQPDLCLGYPQHYDPSDNPFQYYKNFQDNPIYQKDFTQFSADLSSENFPAVSFIKALGIRTEHPGISKISEGANFVNQIVQLISNSSYSENTLLLVVPDESGGYYDHITPPITSSVDHQPYGPRIPLLAIGKFARKNGISHVIMEHSSIVRFIEWNFIGGTPGQLQARDATVNGIGSLLDSTLMGVEVP